MRPPCQGTVHDSGAPLIVEKLDLEWLRSNVSLSLFEYRAMGRRARRSTIEGPRRLARAFPGWLQLSMFAAIERRAGAT
jgi:hypothetical protein